MLPSVLRTVPPQLPEEGEASNSLWALCNHCPLFLPGISTPETSVMTPARAAEEQMAPTLDILVPISLRG